MTETLGDAARRLLAKLDERANGKKAVPAYSGTEIMNPAPVRTVGEKRGAEAQTGEAASQGSPQLTVAREGSGNGLVLAANDNERHAAISPDARARFQ